MESSRVRWSTWHEQVRPLLTGGHGPQKKTLAFLVLGMVVTGSAVLQRVAEVFQERGISEANMTSRERRLAGFLAHARIGVAVIWKQFLSQVLPSFAGQKLRLVLDATPFQEEMTLVYLGLVVHSRVLPRAWKVLVSTSKWEEGQWAMVAGVLDQLTAVLAAPPCTLRADRGVAGFPLVKRCRDHGCQSRLRIESQQTGRRFLAGKRENRGPRFSSRLLKRGSRWFGQARVWQEETIDALVSSAWEEDCEEAWLLISAEEAGWHKIQESAWRMRVEATVQDSKSRGFNIAARWISARARLEGLLVVLVLAIWGTSHLAAAWIQHGQRQRFDRPERRDTSIFRLGRLWLLDMLRRARKRAALRRWFPFQHTTTGWRLTLRL